jgi:hypothetical protein
LKEAGQKVNKSWRGMGAAESNVDKFKNRTAKRGRSWSIQGLQAILVMLGKLYEGKLSGPLSRHLADREEWILDKIKTGAGHIAKIPGPIALLIEEVSQPLIVGLKVIRLYSKKYSGSIASKSTLIFLEQ